MERCPALRSVFLGVILNEMRADDHARVVEPGFALNSCFFEFSSRFAFIDTRTYGQTDRQTDKLTDMESVQ